MPTFDLHTAAGILGVALAGGIIGLDRTAAGQFMVSQPIVAGPLAGWLLGDTAAGMAIGAVLELVWLLDMPVGTFVPADATIGTVAATAIAVLGSGGKASLDLIGFSVVLTTAMVPITMMADAFIRKRNSGLAEAALSQPGQDAGCRLSRAHLSGLVPFFLKSFLLYLFFIPAGLLAVVVFVHLPPDVHAGMALLMKMLPLLGAALILRKLSVGNVYLFFTVGFGAAAVTALLVRAQPLIVILLVTAAGFLASRYVSGGFSTRSTNGRT
jgi:mannose/fructose/N-acetylgalactosamine-specific phosphotransferase system component IIC